MPAAHGRNVALTPHLAKFVDDLVESGTYNNASEVVRDGLRELQRRKHADQLTEIQARIGTGLDELDRGRRFKRSPCRSPRRCPDGGQATARSQVKAVVYAPVALARLADILEYTIEKFGEAQADAYTAQLAAWIEALATGTGPRARRCELLMQGVRDASGLTWYREGSHFLILREKRDTLEVVEILHGRMNLDEHLERLAKEGHHPRP